ncbi:MAG: hypothetical protein FJY67_08175, partial [Calditrichaeota bacterium]|nr:hypothetical protein [Calditrichota bacterium]
MAGLAVVLGIAGGAGEVCADTTWVSGRVAGEWTREGNPYIVVDSTWVAEGDTLRVGPSVKVIFSEETGLSIWGVLEGNGREEDSIAIRVTEGTSHWKGIKYYGVGETVWKYLKAICPDTVFAFAERYSARFWNTTLDAYRPLAGDSRYGIRNCNLFISQCQMRSRSHWVTSGGALSATRSTFDFSLDESDEPGFWSDAATFSMVRCTVIGRLGARQLFADSCRILQTPHGRRIGVGFNSGRITTSYVQGGVSASSLYGQDMILISNNIIEGSLGLLGLANVYGCEIGDILDLYSCRTVVVRNSVINGSLRIFRADTVIVDSCRIGPGTVSAAFASEISIMRSVLVGKIGAVAYDQNEHALFDHNTIIRYADSTYWGTPANQQIHWSNNIFINNSPSRSVFSGPSLPAEFNYNCVWGFDYAGGSPNGRRFELEEFDTTNLIANPMIQWEENMPLLMFNSPCIDRGSPTSPLDPDGTRSDIG